MLLTRSVIAPVPPPTFQDQNKLLSLFDDLTDVKDVIIENLPVENAIPRE